MKKEASEDVLDYPPYFLSEEQKKPLFRASLLKEIAFHYENNSSYRKFCDNKSFNPHNFQGELEDIPFIPIYLFKKISYKLISVPQEKILTQIFSSATSGLASTVFIDKVTARNQTKAMTKVLKEVLGNKRKPFYVFDINPFGPQAALALSRASAVKGYLNFASSAAFFIQASHEDKLFFLEKEFTKTTDKLLNKPSSGPVVIFGFTFVLYYTVFISLNQKGIKLKLPKGSQVIHIGGWKKLSLQKVDKSTFNKTISDVLGIPKENITDIYGFTEQMGLNYPDCKSGWKHVPAYSDVIIRREDNHLPCKNGQKGLLQFLSPIQHSYPGNVILTDDIGHIQTNQCECGLKGKRFQILGRAHRAEIRGCGEVMSEKIVQQPNLQKINSRKDQLEVYHSPCTRMESIPPELILRQIFTKLRDKQAWLRSQPVDAILGLFNEARKIWKDLDDIQELRSNGLDFLIDWCEPRKLRTLLDNSLYGQRSHLDNFIPRREMSHSSLMAVPRGVVSHWLSGNVPFLSLFALIQSSLCKNSNILKVSSQEKVILPTLLKCFKNLNFTTPGGYTIKGNEFLETIAVVYFDRQQEILAKTFSKEADVRIAWGGREAVEAICTLPKKYDTQDIIFGPKTSLMIIGKEALDTEKSLRKISRRAATDVSVFNQFACASPHTIFVEKGGGFSPEQFAIKLADAMEKALVRLPTGLPDIGQTHKIRSKIAEYQFIGKYWHDKQFRWTVLYDENPELADLTYNRVVTVKGINNVQALHSLINSNIQTVGLAMKGQKRLNFAEDLCNKGVMRCPDIGYMTHFDSPWDGLFMTNNLTRWVTLGGP